MWTGKNKLHEERPEVVEDIEGSGLKLDCGNAKESVRLVWVMVGRVDKTVVGVRAVGEVEDGDSHHKADVAAAGRDVRIDWT